MGYAGRFGIYELLVTTEPIRQLAHDRASSWELKKAALAEGMKPLRMDAWEKAIMGNTSIEEVVRLTKGDRI